MFGHEDGRSYREGIFDHAQEHIRERLGRRIRSQTRSRLGAVRTQGQRAARKQSKHPDSWIEVSECGSREDCARWHANESVDHIPNGIDSRHFVGYELHKIKADRRAQHPRMTQITQAAGQLYKMEPLQ